ncbi:MAG: transposase [Acidobacteriota bacterium]|nr:transposase [Acidobacteriota bacterium]
MTKGPELFDVGGISVEIGPPVSTDGGLVFVARHVRGSAWFKALVPTLRRAIVVFAGQRFGFAGEEKLARTLLAMICGFAMGYRSGKEIADVIEADKLWRKVLGSRVPQIDLSRLVCVLAEVGVDPLRMALLASAAAGGSALQLDGDSSLLELHGKQEGGAFNGHYKEFGYHAGWMLEGQGRLAALWLNEGNAHTADGQAEKLEWMLAQGVPIGSYRGDAGMPSPKLMSGLEAMGATYAMRLRSNPRLDEAAQAICPELPKVGGAAAFREFQHAVKSWGAERRVVVKFQVPETKDGAAALFAESFYFVTNRDDAPAKVVEHYLNRGEAERRFGEFVAAFEPTFRHAEMAKNEAWAQLLALAHNVLVDLRAKVDGGQELKPRPSLKPIKGEGGWSALATTFTMSCVKPSLVRFRAFALKLANAALDHARSQWLRLSPQHIRPAWTAALIAG